ncbi:UNVERIFIED_CONTAM: hypothetical protein FOS11_33290 [Bacillus thuringiensis]
MINPYCIKNRAIGSVYTTHGAQSTMHAVYHAMQHMPYYQANKCKYIKNKKSHSLSMFIYLYFHYLHRQCINRGIF